MPSPNDQGMAFIFGGGGVDFDQNSHDVFLAYFVMHCIWEYA